VALRWYITLPWAARLHVSSLRSQLLAKALLVARYAIASLVKIDPAVNSIMDPRGERLDPPATDWLPYRRIRFSYTYPFVVAPSRIRSYEFQLYATQHRVLGLRRVSLSYSRL
jgi:hypothetical protein